MLNSKVVGISGFSKENTVSIDLLLVDTKLISVNRLL